MNSNTYSSIRCVIYLEKYKCRTRPTYENKLRNSNKFLHGSKNWNCHSLLPLWHPLFESLHVHDSHFNPIFYEGLATIRYRNERWNLHLNVVDIGIWCDSMEVKSMWWERYMNWKKVCIDWFMWGAIMLQDPPLLAPLMLPNKEIQKKYYML